MAVEVDLHSLERRLQGIMRRYERTRNLLEDLAAVRDEAIRAAHAAGVTPGRLAEITGLSKQRIDQIRRGARL